MLKRIAKFIFTATIILCPLCCSAADENFREEDLKRENVIQTKISNTGVSILNSNKIDERISFAYDKTEAKEKLILDKALLTRQIIIYGYDYKFIEDDNELAAMLSRRIAEGYRSYSGAFNGRLSSLKMKAAPKKYQLVFDKIAVDYMVRAGYNPIAMITFINKSCPQKRNDTISHENLTSKRLAEIYEYIYTKYPYYLKNNDYFNNVHYQNFLLTSAENRKLLQNKIKSGSKEKLKYE